ncbi:hypothetical protein AOQ84DRAFT_410695 [Glonium stellatum]|uniref:Uncharacterized protein n=1 Tax=Glonium stellatum TaxID=574774 RepID=A0A8E2JRB8_9PEZI|nr:hypothetical protein AOQ84DRAFT_410695 [Glonium stellatum]
MNVNEISMWLQKSLFTPKRGSQLALGKWESVVEIITALCRHGLNPNEKYDGSTIWIHFLSLYRILQNQNREAVLLTKILKLFLRSASIDQMYWGECCLIKSFLDDLGLHKYGENILQAFRMLLSHGLDPNLSVDGGTVWDLLLQKIGPPARVGEGAISSGFLSYGANPHCKSIQSSLECLSEKKKEVVAKV